MKIKIGALCTMLTIILPNVIVIAADKPIVTCSQIACKQGESTTLVCNISNNSGVAAWLINVSFDNNNFDFKTAKAGEAFSSGTFMSSVKENGDVVLMWYNTQNNKNNGEMFQLELVAHDNSEIGTYPITIACSEINTVNETGETVDIVTSNGTIEVKQKEERRSSSGSGSSRTNSGKSENNEISDEKSELEASGNVSQKKISFNDVSESEYYYGAVTWAVESGVTVGTEEGTFSPGDICTRAQAVTFLWRTAGSPEPAIMTSVFEDVNSDDYYYKAVMWALENSITEGTGNNTFSPDATVTRAQIVTFMWRLAGSDKSDSINAFSDVKENDYYYNAVLWAVGKDITKGTDSKSFSPVVGCTRGQMVTFLYRYSNLNK